MSLTWKPGEAHWCYYSCVRLPAFRAHYNQTVVVVGGGGEDDEQPGWACDAVGPKKGPAGRGRNQRPRSHARGCEGEHLCKTAARGAAPPACPPRRLGPVAPSGVGVWGGGGGCSVWSQGVARFSVFWPPPQTDVWWSHRIASQVLLWMTNEGDEHCR